jgi:hypothetical protein
MVIMLYGANSENDTLVRCQDNLTTDKLEIKDYQSSVYGIPNISYQIDVLILKIIF